MNKKYIDVDEFVKEINDRIDAAFKWGESAAAYEDEEIKTRVEQAVATFCEAILTAMKMPTADVQQVQHGHWVYEKGDCFPICSVCGEHHGTLYEHRYCPVCGASMDEDERWQSI